MSDIPANPFDARSLEPHIAALLALADRSATFTLEALSGGRNNRSFRIRSGDGDSMLKWYFSHPDDVRDRLGAEFEFGRCLWRHGLRQVAQPLAADRIAGLGLYQFLPGKTPARRDVTQQHHRLAVAFLQQINSCRSTADARQLPSASEACFSLAEHIACVDRRLQCLLAVPAEDASSRDMLKVLSNELQPAFAQWRTDVLRWAATEGLDPKTQLGEDQRCLSPSDFGFHNTLLQEDGSLRFVDFEYAGWDDPAKLVGDFFCQIDVPANGSEFDTFLERVASLFAAPEPIVQRARQLFPLYQLKWCCIVLNDFLPTGGARRIFSQPGELADRRMQQLTLARQLLERVGCLPGSG